MTLSALFVFVASLTGGLLLAGYMGSSHHWLVGVLSLPLGFLACATVICLLQERWSRGPFAQTPSKLRALVIGLIFGVVLGVMFFFGVSQELIPTVVADSQGHGPDRGSLEWQSVVAQVAPISALTFGLSVALTVSFFLMLHYASRRSNAPNVA